MFLDRRPQSHVPNVDGDFNSLSSSHDFLFARFKYLVIFLPLFFSTLTVPQTTGPSWNKDASIESALLSFCQNIPCTPEKLLRTAYGIRNFSSAEMDRLFIKTEMYLKSKTAASSSVPASKGIGTRSRSSDVLPTSQSQVQVQMMSHTLTIREASA